MKKLSTIYLQDCNFEGNIPAEWAGLEKCTNLILKGNKLKGVVPEAVQNHTYWKEDKWKVNTNILPQQSGYGLTLTDGNGGQDLGGEEEVDPWN